MQNDTKATLSDPDAAVRAVVDGFIEVSLSADRIAHAITADAIQGTDALGGGVTSLTEAVMGITAGLGEIAGAIHALAGAISDHTHATGG